MTCWTWLSINHHCLSFQLLVLVVFLKIQVVDRQYQKLFLQKIHLISRFLWNLYRHFGYWKPPLMLSCGDHKLYHHKALLKFQDLPESEPLATRNWGVETVHQRTIWKCRPWFQVHLQVENYYDRLWELLWSQIRLSYLHLNFHWIWREYW